MIGVLNILDRTGHTTVTWDTADPALVAEVEKIFAEKKAEGYLAYAGTDDDYTVIRDFDREAAQITLSPQLVGG